MIIQVKNINPLITALFIGIAGGCHSHALIKTATIDEEYFQETFRENNVSLIRYICSKSNVNETRFFDLIVDFGKRRGYRYAAIKKIFNCNHNNNNTLSEEYLIIFSNNEMNDLGLDNILDLNMLELMSKKE